MTVQLATVSLSWDGVRLTSVVVCTREFGWLTDLPAPARRRLSVPCADVEALTPFQLGLFLHDTMAPVTLTWESARERFRAEDRKGGESLPLF
jgi:hypothetical protein